VGRHHTLWDQRLCGISICVRHQHSASPDVCLKHVPLRCVVACTKVSSRWVRSPASQAVAAYCHLVATLCWHHTLTSCCVGTVYVWGTSTLQAMVCVSSMCRCNVWWPAQRCPPGGSRSRHSKLLRPTPPGGDFVLAPHLGQLLFTDHACAPPPPATPCAPSQPVMCLLCACCGGHHLYWSSCRPACCCCGVNNGAAFKWVRASSS
jgi:hypothetical protein